MYHIISYHIVLYCYIVYLAYVILYTWPDPRPRRGPIAVDLCCHVILQYDIVLCHITVSIFVFVVMLYCNMTLYYVILQ